MKRYMTYEELYNLCGSIVDKINENGDKFDEIIAVVRGGMTPAHIMSKMMGLPVGAYIPGTKRLLTQSSRVLGNRFLIVEDLVAEGRTFNQIRNHFNVMKNSQVYPYNDYLKWEFCPILVDAGYKGDFKYYGMKTDEWVVFPYEDFDAVVEGDRGLFREGTDKYGKI